MKLAMIGLGRMGSGMARRLLAAGHQVVGYDPQATVDLAEKALSLEDVVRRLAPPRLLWLMLPAGPPVRETAALLAPRLAAGDVVVDGGNSRHGEAALNAEALAPASFLDVGVSGGVRGERDGYCLMAGGPKAAVELARPVLDALGPWARVGDTGSGHFAKMVHNAIEYGLMQAYAEGFALLHDGPYRQDLPAVAELWTRGSVIRSWLLELASEALAAEPGLESLEAWVDDSGEGRWALEEAVKAGVPAPALAAALFERFRSRRPDDFGDRLLAALRRRFGGHGVKKR